MITIKNIFASKYVVFIQGEKIMRKDIIANNYKVKVFKSEINNELFTFRLMSVLWKEGIYFCTTLRNVMGILIWSSYIL